MAVARPASARCARTLRTELNWLLLAAGATDRTSAATRWYAAPMRGRSVARPVRRGGTFDTGVAVTAAVGPSRLSVAWETTIGRTGGVDALGATGPSRPGTLLWEPSFRGVSAPVRSPRRGDSVLRRSP